MSIWDFNRFFRQSISFKGTNALQIWDNIGDMFRDRFFSIFLHFHLLKGYAHFIKGKQ